MREHLLVAVLVGLVGTTGSATAERSWTGAYAGLDFIKSDLDVKFKGTNFDFDPSGYGVHAGYLHDFGNFVLGGEVDVARTKYTFGSGATAGRSKQNQRAIKAILGYSFGKFMPYATVGLFNQSSVSSATGQKISNSGTVYGLGLSYQATESIRVGLTYSKHVVKNLNNISGLDAHRKDIGLRVSYSF
ncbi:MAG: outer membrane protein [Halocynthiibacter sp.]